MTAHGSDLSAQLEEERPRLLGLAYRMLGSVADAEDVVQETFARWQEVEPEEIGSAAAWLTTVCMRVAIDTLRSASRQREVYVGPWLPEPLDAGRAGSWGDPAVLSESLSTAFLLVLERLSPLERAAYLLREIFHYEYGELAEILDRSEGACRQLVSRSRRHVRNDRKRFQPAPDHARQLLKRFLEAARLGDLPRLESMLARDAELWSDSGGKAAAARNVVHGAGSIARFLTGVAAGDTNMQVELTNMNAGPGLLFRSDGRVTTAVSLAVDEEGRVARIFLIRNPDKLRHAQED